MSEWQAHAIELHNWQLVPWMLKFTPADMHSLLICLLAENMLWRAS